MKAQVPFDKFLLDHARRSYENVKRGEISRTQIAVTLIRRNRGANISDCIGEFSPNPGSLTWLMDQPPEDLQYSRIRTINIVKREIRAAVANMITARSEIDVEAANKDPRLGGAANLLQGLSEVFDGQDYWSDAIEDQGAEMPQTNYGVFILVDHDPEEDGIKVNSEDWKDQQQEMPGEYACEACSSVGPFMGEVVPHDSGIPRVQCPKCGQAAEVIREPYKEEIPVPDQKEVNTGMDGLRLISPFQIRLDEKHTLGGQIHRATWFEDHPIMSKDELEAEFPGWKFGAPADWSFPMKWKKALETGTDYIKSRSMDGWDREYEVRKRWLRPKEYANYVFPVPYRMVDGEGRVVFEAGPGEKAIDHFPNGFCYWIEGDVILPKIYPSDFRNLYSYFGFLSDAHSAWMQPRVELIQLQKDVNRDYTLDRMHRESNARVGIAYDSTEWGADDFEEDLMGSKKALSKPIDQTFKTWTTPAMNEAANGMRLMFDLLLPNLGIAQSAMLGMRPTGDQNYSAELLQRQSSLGLLNPYNKSKSRAKVSTFKNWARMIQKIWPPQKFEYVMTRAGIEWQEEDIEAFIESNIDRDFTIDYIEGSDIPVTRMEREIKMGAFLDKAGANPALQPFITKEMVAAFVKASGLDYDIGDDEADDRLETSRYDKIKDGIEQMKGRLPIMQIVPMVLSRPEFYPLPDEDHEHAIKFYTKRQIVLLSDEFINQPLIAALEGMKDRHKQAGVVQIQMAQEAQMAAQAPMIEAQQLMAGQQAEQQAAQSQADIEIQREQAAIQGEQAEAERMAQSEESERQREHEKEMADRQAQLKEREIESKERLAKKKDKVAA